MDSDEEDDRYILRAEREAKQNYLREEILEMDYDPDLFTNYCESLKAPDIDAWDFEELQDCVRNFKVIYRPGQTLKELYGDDYKLHSESSHAQEFSAADHCAKIEDPGPQDSCPESSPPEEILEFNNSDHNRSISPAYNGSSIKTPEKSPNAQGNLGNTTGVLESNEILDVIPNQGPTSVHSETSDKIDNHQDYMFVLECSVLPETELSLVSYLRVTVVEHEIIQSGIFFSKYQQYEVSVPALRWTVLRRYNDFYWLRNILSIRHCDCYIPPIPPKKTTGNFSAGFISKRKTYLSKFINKVILSSTLRSTRYVLEFLKNNNLESFEDYKRSTLEISKPENIQEISNLDGEIICDISDKSLMYAYLDDYVDLSMILEKKLKQSCGAYIKSTLKLSSSLSEFSNILKELQNTQDSIPNNYENSELYEAVYNNIVKWSVHEEINAKNLKTELKLHLSYKSDEKSVMKNMIKLRNQHQSKFKKSLHPKTPIDESDQIKNMFGYYNYKIQREIERNISEDIIIDIDQYSELAEMEINKLETLQNFWEVSSNSFFRVPKLI